jgi:DNA ligase-associated metallophosphoesterase
VTLAARAIEAEQEAAIIRVGGLSFLADRSGALYFAEDRILLVADLHLEKGSAFARRGSMLPPYDSRATLAALAAVVERYDPGCIVVMGDAFHEDGADDRMDGADVEALLGLQKGRDWIWLSGNHDPRGPRRFGGAVLQSLAFGGVTLRHAPQAGAGEAEITGHLHPVGKVSLRGRAVRRRCFATDGRRCVMPAFGAYAGGLNVLDKAFSTLFDTAGFTAHILGKSRIFRVGAPMLRPD